MISLLYAVCCMLYAVAYRPPFVCVVNICIILFCPFRDDERVA